MILIDQKPPSKAWRLIRNSLTGDIITDYSAAYSYSIDGFIKAQQKSADDLANGFDGLVIGNWRDRTKYKIADLEQLDHIPVYRGKLKFVSIHNGTSSVQVYFESLSGGSYLMVGDYVNKFFTLVGKGVIEMDAAGYYEFDFSFVKKSEKVFMTLVTTDD